MERTIKCPYCNKRFITTEGIDKKERYKKGVGEPEKKSIIDRESERRMDF